MDKLYSILLACAVLITVAVVVVLAILLPWAPRHHEPHPSFSIVIDRDPYPVKDVLPLPNFQPMGSFALADAEYTLMDPHITFNQDHMVGLVLGKLESTPMTYRLLAVRGIDAAGELAMNVEGETIEAFSILQVALFGKRGYELRAAVVTVPSANSTSLAVHLLGYTTGLHWHIYETYTLAWSSTSTQFHRVAFVTTDSGPVLVMLEEHVLRVVRMHDIKHPRELTPLKIEQRLGRKAMQVSGSHNNRLLVTLQHDLAHHGFLEYDWNDSRNTFEVGKETLLHEHESMDHMHVGGDGNYLLAHMDTAQVRTWNVAQSWAKSYGGDWERLQTLHPVDPVPSSFSLATSENSDLIAWAVQGHARTYVHRKQPGHWIITGGLDPDPVALVPLDSEGLCLSLSRTLRTATLWIRTDARTIQWLRWTF